MQQLGDRRFTIAFRCLSVFAQNNIFEGTIVQSRKPLTLARLGRVLADVEPRLWLAS